jgi:hypothetical protein
VTLGRLEQAIGALLVLLVLLDVFLTVLYARIHRGVFSYRIARLIWRAFLWAAGPVGSRRGEILEFCGPAIVVALIATWSFALACGAALIIHPELGPAVRSSGGPTPTDFTAALYAGGSSQAIVGSSDFEPRTPAFRLFYTFNSLVGFSVLSLTLTYLMQVYTALQRRNTLALRLHLASAGTGDAADLIAGLGPQGRFDGGYTNLVSVAEEMAGMQEAHHFYPVLFYFRFRDPYYSVSRSTLVSLDVVTLIKSALADQPYAWLKQSVSVAQLWEASLMLVTTLLDTFRSGGVPAADTPPDAETLGRWRRRYAAALRRLQQAGIQTVADERAGAEVYASLRGHWDHYVAALAPFMAYRMDEIDPAGCHADSADQGRELRAPLRSAS